MFSTSIKKKKVCNNTCVTNTIIILFFFYFSGKCFLHFSMFGTMENAMLLHGPPIRTFKIFQFYLAVHWHNFITYFLVENARLLHGPFYLWDLLSCLNFILQLIDTMSLLLNFGGKWVLFTYWIPSVYTKDTEYVFVNFRLDLLKLERTPSN